MINEKFFLKVAHFEKVTLTAAPLSYNIWNNSKENDKYNKFHRNSAYEIIDIRGTEQSICTDTYLVGYLLESI